MIFSSPLVMLSVATDASAAYRLQALFVTLGGIVLFGFVLATVADWVNAREKAKRRKAYRIFTGRE